MKQRVNSLFNESFKLFKIINSYLSFRRFCCEIFHVGVLEKHVLQIMLYIYIFKNTYKKETKPNIKMNLTFKTYIFS